MSKSSSDWIFEERRAVARDAIARFFDGSVGLLKWVLTSTALFHSAALIAGFNSSEFAPLMFAGPAWVFLAGIALTLAAGLSLSFGAADHAGKLTNSLWKGEGFDTIENETYDPEPNKVIVVGSIFLGLAIGAFVLGVVFTAYEISRLSDPSTRIEKIR